MNKLLTTKEFIKRSKKIYKNKYNYKFVNYKGKDIKVKLLCNEHNKTFYQTPHNHYKNVGGCEICKFNKLGKNNVLTTKEFIKRSNKTHKNKYDYSKTNYKTMKLYVKIICKKHGEFLRTPSEHIYDKLGCPICSNRVYDTNSFIIKANKLYKNKYDYSKTNYKTAHEKIIIICKKHGEFFQSPTTHLIGCGCPKCGFRRSKCEEIIEKYLIKNKINYIPQKKFDTCKGIKMKLPFDFYLPDYNLCIEYDGEQHYKNFKLHNTLSITKKNDKIKTKWCKLNNIKLLRIPYWEKKNIKQILKNILTL